MKVLLIYPEIPDTFWGFRHALKFLQKKSNFPPLGLLTVAAMLPDHWAKRLVDLNVTKLTETDLEWADYAFVSAMFVQRESAREIISRCKKANLRVVSGGPLFTTEHVHFEDVNHFVLNEAELTLPPFLADLEEGCAGRVYQASEFCDIRKAPAPVWELADLNKYARMSIQFSRGCPFDCEFCDVTALFGHGPRIKTAQQILCELDALYNQGWRGGVFFVDDNFIGNKSYLKTDLLPALIKWRKGKRGMQFHTQVTVHLADDQELMKMMVEAGFDEVFIGIESPDQESLAECNKRLNKNRDLLQSVKRVHQAGLQVQGGFIVGFDNDTPSIFQRQIEFIQKSGIVIAMVGLLQALPRTRLYERLEKEGRLIDFGSGDNVDGKTNIIPKMGLDTLREGYRGLMQFIYSPEHYYERARTFLRDYNAPEIWAPLGFHRFTAFFLSIIHLGIFGKERVQYWKMLIWTLFHRPRLFRLAIAVAIYGHHLRKICELRIL